MNSLPETKTRKIHIDILRLIAICCVVYMHIEIAVPPPINATGYYVYLAINMCIRTAIPIFFMISGAVLLHKTEKLNIVIKKRIFTLFHYPNKCHYWANHFWRVYY